SLALPHGDGDLDDVGAVVDGVREATSAKVDPFGDPLKAEPWQSRAGFVHRVDHFEEVVIGLAPQSDVNTTRATVFVRVCNGFLSYAEDVPPGTGCQAAAV